MKVFSTLILIGAAVLSVSMKSQANNVLTATARTSLSECHSWDDTTLEEKLFLQDDAAKYAQVEMQTACLAQAADLTPEVLNVTPVGYKCQSFAKIGMYLMTVAFTCAK